MDHSIVRPLVRRVDGWHSIEIGPGEISFGEDQNTRQVDGKRGHLSGTCPYAGAVGDVTDNLYRLAIGARHRRVHACPSETLPSYPS